MSDIDTFDHSFVGLFNKLPLYHPLQDSKMDHFNVNAQNLIIGGGSGEHPAMLVHNLDACVYSFLETSATLAYDEKIKKEIEDKLEIFNDLIEDYNIYDNLEMGGWDMNTITEFCNSLDDDFSKYDKLKERFKITGETGYISAEEKIQIMLGEFLYYSGRKLLKEDTQNFLKENKELFDKTVCPIFYAVKCEPKGYPTSGRYFKNQKEHNSWGFSYDQEDTIEISWPKNKKTTKPKVS